MTDGLPHCRAAALQDAQVGRRWLIEELWAEQGVGIVGGAPKCCKSWMGLDMVVSVASGTPCLGRYEVSTPGTALCFLAEDDAATVKSRLHSIAASRALDLAPLPIEVITAASLRLDSPRDQQLLDQTVREVSPRLLLLDPFVRIHRIDENDAGQVSGVLAYLRQLQRQHHVAVVVVHHARKNGSVASSGQALRGSGDFHAWVDSALYLRRVRDGLTMSVEHRAAAAPTPIPLRLIAGDTPHLEITDPEQTPDEPAPDHLADNVLAALNHAPTPLSRSALRAALHVRNERLGDTLTNLANSGLISRVGDAWTPVPVPLPQCMPGNGTT